MGIIAFLVTIAAGAVLIRAAWPGSSDHHVHALRRNRAPGQTNGPRNNPAT